MLNQRIWKNQKRKISDNKWKQLITYTSIETSTLKKLNIFHYLQTLFARLSIFSHFNFKHQLYIDLDVLKEFSFNIHIYYAKMNLTKTSSNNTAESNISEQNKTEFILFLSQLLSDAETQYWFIELKIADIIWIIKKVCHMIKTAEKFTIIYTDHFITVFIVCQLSLNIINDKKLNLCLI